VDWFHQLHHPLVSPCECGNETLVSINGCEVSNPVNEELAQKNQHQLVLNETLSHETKFPR
jgi:hypothetical protein